jgi:hypothetical protein
VRQLSIPSRTARSQRQVFLAVTMTVFLFGLPVAARAATMTVPSYKITSNLPATGTPADGPSTLQAGANPDAGSWSTFSYPNATEDIKTAITNFAPGLLGNPEAVPKCSEAALQAGGATCPAGSTIGTSRLDTFIPSIPAPGPSLAGIVYNAEPLGNEPGRLGVVTPTGASTFLVSSIPFEITPRGASDYGLTGTLTDISRLPPPPFDLQVVGLGFVINGSSNKYVRNPTSCVAGTATGQAIGYDDPTVVDSPPYTFTPTGCDTVPFSPTVSMQIGDRGTTKAGGYPPFVLKVTLPSGNADLRNTKLTLPVELNTNNSAYKLCTEAEAAADNCPANSRFGTAIAKSPFLSEQLGGPVYLLSESGHSLPGLLLDLQGRAHVKIKTTTELVNGRQIQSLATDSPQLPVSELRVALNGGKSTGVFTNRTDLCFKGNSSSKFNAVNGVAKLEGWNGKNTGDVKVAATVQGCGPGVQAKLSGGIASGTKLSVTVTKHPDASNMKEIVLTLSRNLTLIKSRLSGGARGTAAAVTLGGASFSYLGRHRLKVSGLPAAGSATVTVQLSKGAVQLSKGTRRRLQRGHSRRFRVKAMQTPVLGLATSTRGKFTAKSKRRLAG